MKKSYGFLLAALGVAAVSQVQAQNTIFADWTFETSKPTTAGPFSPESGTETATATATGSHAGATVYSNPAGNGSSHSFSSTLWAVGDYYEVEFSTVGFSGIQLSYDQTSSGTGPGQFQLQWSTDGTTFNNIGSIYTVQINGAPNTAWNATTSSSVYSFADDLSAITQINNQATVFLRFEDASTVSANGGTVATGGTDRMDNIIVAVPEPSTMALLSLGGLAGLGFSFRRKK
jgi:hypothetical protein